MTHVYEFNDWIINGSGNGLSVVLRLEITWTDAGILSVENLNFFFKKMHFKLSSAKCRPFCWARSPRVRKDSACYVQTGLSLALKLEDCHDAQFVLTDGTGGCHKDNFCHNDSHRWRQSWHHDIIQGLYSLSGRTSYRKISWSLETERLGVIMFVSFWNLTGISPALLPRCLSNFRAIANV